LYVIPEDVAVAEAVGQDPVARVVAARACDVEVGGLAARLEILSALRAQGVQNTKFGVVTSCGLEHGV
jgi:hypothetical protein